MRNINYHHFLIINSYKKSTYMNTKIKQYLALIVFVVLSVPIFAQVDVSPRKSFYDYNRDWTFGIHGGASWQQSDINDRFGGGLGLSLGRRFYGEPNSFWALDWRGRLDYSNSFGQSSLTSFDTTRLNNFLSATNADGVAEYDDYFLENYRTDMVDIDLEFILTANRLRERTGVILQGFGGLGFNFYNSKIDQLNTLGQTYDYQSIDLNQTDRQIRRDAAQMRNEFFRGGDYESGEGTKLTFMPSWGLGIGYQLRPWFSFGYEHRFAAPFTDNLDTKVEANPGLDWTNDKHHLSYLYARFHFGADADCMPPAIRIISPTANPLSTQAPSINVEAEIQHLTNRNELTVTVNGLPNYSFNYNASNDRFNVQVLLEAGENTIRIQANNKCDEEFVVIKVIYTPDVVAGTPPSVVFTQPSTDRYTTTDQNYMVNARVERVKSKTDISLLVNGQSTRDFSYDTQTGVVSVNIECNEGQNTVQVTGKNKFGEDSEMVYITYNKPTAPAPVVDITRPSNSPFNASEANFRVEARLTNVASKQDVNFTLNGVASDFSYSNGNFVANIVLAEGENLVEISGYNTVGSDKDQATIILKPTVIEPVSPPVVNITNPTANPTTVNSSTANIDAIVRNVDGKNNITFTVNGKSVSNFSYNANSDAFEANINLIEGANTIKIEGSNSAGKDDDTRTIIYQKIAPVVRPPVVKVATPDANPHNTTTEQQSIKATVNNAEKSQITFTVNGQITTNFSFNDATDIFTADITLIEGANVFEISAFNASGSDKDGRTIIYKKTVTVQPPTVDITSPAQNALVYGTTQKINATVTNVINKNQITFTVNGANSSDFTYNANTNSFEGNASNLVSGTNTVQITATNTAGTDNDQVTFLVRISVNPPTVNIQNPATNPATVSVSPTTIEAKVTGVANKNEVTVLLNGNATAFSLDNNGIVKASLTLVEGANTLIVTATNGGGVATDNRTIIYKKVVAPKPQITVTAPTRNPHDAISERQTITAKISNVSSRAGVSFTMNGTESNGFTFDAGSGAFSVTTDLNEGSNRFVIVAKNDVGEDSYKGEIIFKAPLPQVTIHEPANNAVVSTENIAVSATIENVATKNDVIYSLNGVESSAFLFDAKTGAFSVGAKLNAGKNTITITGKNAAGNDKQTVEVVYNATSGQKPVITVTNLNTSPYTTLDGKIGVEGKILYIDGQNDASITVNGTTTTNWTYDNLTDKYLIDHPWQVGTNNVVITATNSAGTSTKTQVIIFRQVVAPQVQFTSPVSNGGNTSVAKEVIDIQATVQNADKREITFTVNGKQLPYTLTGSDFSAKVTLATGANTARIVAKNEGGESDKSITIDYAKPVIAPKVSFTKPSGSITVNSNSFSVRATVENMDSKQDISVLVNNQSVNNFSFNSASGALGFEATLNEGANNIVITARNSAGIDNQSITISYKKPSVDAPSDNNKGDLGSRRVEDNQPKPSVTKPKETTSSTSISLPKKPTTSEPKPSTTQPSKPVQTKTEEKKPATVEPKPSTTQPSKPVQTKPEEKKPADKQPVNKITEKPAAKKPEEKKDNNR
jgi:large repetitive protein